MKLLQGLIICFAVNFVRAKAFNSSLALSISSQIELERKVLELRLENCQLLRENSDMRIENANLRLELLSAKENEKLLMESHDSWNKNLTSLVDNTELIAENLKTLWKNVSALKSDINEEMDEYGAKIDKILTHFPVLDEEVLRVACDAKLSNGTWTVIQRRMNGETNFYRPWAHYKTGFGNTKAEFFIGLDNLHILTTCSDQELLVEMEDNGNKKRHAQYDLFEVGSERESYILKEVGTYSGDAGDSLSYHKSQKFSTFDEDNDSDPRNCAKFFKGAWWHKACHRSNLNGEYGNHKFGEGINWKTFSGHEQSLKFIEMKIRPKSN